MAADPRLYDVTVALTETERLAVEQEALARGVTVSRLIRERVFTPAQALELSPEIDRR